MAKRRQTEEYLSELERYSYWLGCECGELCIKKNELAKAIGKSANAVADYFSGHRLPSPEARERIDGYINSKKYCEGFRHIPNGIFLEMVRNMYYQYHFVTEEDIAREMGRSQSFVAKFLAKYGYDEKRTAFTAREQRSILMAFYSRTVDKYGSPIKGREALYKKLRSRLGILGRPPRRITGNDEDDPGIPYRDLCCTELGKRVFLALPRRIQWVILEHRSAFFEECYLDFEMSDDYIWRDNVRGAVEGYRKMAKEQRDSLIRRLEDMTADCRTVSGGKSKLDEVIADIACMIKITSADSFISDYYNENAALISEMLSPLPYKKEYTEEQLKRYEHFNDDTVNENEYRRRLTILEHISLEEHGYEELYEIEERFFGYGDFLPDPEGRYLFKLGFAPDEWYLWLLLVCCKFKGIDTDEI